MGPYGLDVSHIAEYARAFRLLGLRPLSPGSRLGPMTERASALVTLLFTDLVSSTELLSRAGDEEAHRIAHTFCLRRTEVGTTNRPVAPDLLSGSPFP